MLANVVKLVRRRHDCDHSILVRPLDALSLLDGAKLNCSVLNRVRRHFDDVPQQISDFSSPRGQEWYTTYSDLADGFNEAIQMRICSRVRIEHKRTDRLL